MIRIWKLVKSKSALFFSLKILPLSKKQKKGLFQFHLSIKRKRNKKFGQKNKEQVREKIWGAYVVADAVT